MSNSAQPTPSPAREPSNLEAARALYLALDKAFPMMECRKALYRDPDPEKAAQWLTDGGWRAFKLISWNHQGLAESERLLCAELGLPSALVSKVLKDCGGSAILARKKLTLQSLLG
jgi:hypothetical protein